MSTPPGPGFTIAMSAATADALRELHDTAAAGGQHPAFVAALEIISDRLRSDPASFGEELFDLHVLRMTVQLALVLPVAAEFGVYHDRRLVMVRAFHFLLPH